MDLLSSLRATNDSAALKPTRLSFHSQWRSSFLVLVWYYKGLQLASSLAILGTVDKMASKLRICDKFVHFNSGSLRPSNTGNIFVQLVAQQMLRCDWDCLLRLLPPLRSTNFHVAISSLRPSSDAVPLMYRTDVYFLQHENLVRGELVTRATFFGQQVVRKCCPHYLAFTLPLWSL